MLQQIRERAQGWFAWIIIILITVPFALWGIQSYLGMSGTAAAATVNGHDIPEGQFDQRVQQTRMQLREQLGTAYDAQLFGGQRLREQVLERMIRETLLLDMADQLQLRTSDHAVRATILAEPFFQVNGQFDNASYERMLALQGLTPTRYEDDLRQRLVTTQLERAVTATAFTTVPDVDAAVRWTNQQRHIAFVRWPRSAFLSKTPPTDAAIEQFYRDHQADWTTPEQVRVHFVQLTTAAAQAAAIDEATLRTRYDERRAEFTTPAQRHVRHILLTVPADAPADADAAVKQRVLALRQRLVAAPDQFATLAQTQSEDKVTAARGGELGDIALESLDPVLAQAAAQLAVGVVSEPVRSRFGYHLLVVTAITPEQLKPFVAVREQLAAEAAKTAAEESFFDQAERLATLTYESPDSLVPAAEALGLKIQTSDWLPRTGGAGVFADPKVMGAAFSDEVRVQGRNSEVLEPAATDASQMQALVLRVDDYRPAALQPLADVRTQIVTRLQEQLAADAARAAATALQNRLQQGAAFPTTVAHGTVTDSGAVTADTDKIPAAIVAQAFKLPRPAAGQAVYAMGQVEHDAFVVRVTAVTDGTLTAADQAAARQALTTAHAHAAFEQLVADVQQRAQIERKIAVLADNAAPD